ncbi:MAG: type II toxin-antitoxin system prevent-host-death family antitoxin [Holosporaceae bacterium]|nr:type II toxin-antitoxin system prevent-host-death family antitoxin [Holosporaceae bacterium]
MERQVSYAEAKDDLSAILNRVCLNHEPILIKRREGGNTVVVSEDDWNSIQETLYLMSSSKDWKAITEPIRIEECSDSLPW